MRAVSYVSAEAFLEDAHRLPLDCLILDIQLSRNVEDSGYRKVGRRSRMEF